MRTHGIRNTYQAGCRCEQCRAANTARSRGYRRAKGIGPRRARVDHRIEELDFLIGGGVPVEEAVARLGWSMAAAARTLRRRGRVDLARPLERQRAAAWRQRAVAA